MAIITKQLALVIVKKLKAKPSAKRGKKHDFYEVHYEGRLVAIFGIRRGSGKELSHDHLPSQLHLGPGQTRRLAQCHIELDGWLESLREQGLLGEEQPGTS